jgi:large subunit ribosomal protein L24
MAKSKAIKGTVRVKVKRGDQVVFIAGKEFNRFDTDGNRIPYRGRVIAVDPRKGKVKVEGAMIAKRHRKAIPQMNIEGGIFEKEAWVNISNVAHIDPETGKPTRVKYEIKDGEKVRVAKSGKVIPEPGYVKREKREETPVEENESEESETKVEDKSKQEEE